MGTLGNVLWIFFGGLVITIEYLITGLVLCATIIGIPFGIQCFKLAALTIWPFDREISSYQSNPGLLGLLFGTIWFFLAGIWICITHLIIAVILTVTIIGIPFAKQHSKLATLALAPFGKEIV